MSFQTARHLSHDAHARPDRRCCGAQAADERGNASARRRKNSGRPATGHALAPFSKGGVPTGAGIWKYSGDPRRWTFGAATSPGSWAAPSSLREEGAEPADKPGSVVDSHSSRRIVADTLEQPTRRHRGPRYRLPIWPCSRWGLPCRPVARLAVRSYRTISPLPRICTPFSSRTVRRYLSVALSVGSRRPGVTWHRALWSPDFPRHPPPPKWLRMTRLPGRLRHDHCGTTGDRLPTVRRTAPCAARR